MKRKSFLVLAAICAFVLPGCKKNTSIKDTLKSVNGDKAHIVFLYGQSNAEGWSHNEYLKLNDIGKYNEYSNGYDNVYINFLNAGGQAGSDYTFEICKLGCGAGQGYFGPEVGIAEKMHDVHSNETTFIIKWAWGGTALYNMWLNGKKQRGDLYGGAIDFTKACLDYLKDKGYTLCLDGICWMQGESDSMEITPEEYYNCTVAFVSYLRNDLKKYQENIRFVDAGINETEGIWVNPDQINNFKKKFASESELNFYVDTKELGLSSVHEPYETPDIAHWDSLSMVKLGQAFGEIVSK